MPPSSRIPDTSTSMGLSLLITSLPPESLATGSQRFATKLKKTQCPGRPV